MGRAFSPHGLWDAPLSRGDTPGWYGDAPLVLEEWFLSGLWPCWRPEEGLCRCGDAPFGPGQCPESPRWWPVLAPENECVGCGRFDARRKDALGACTRVGCLRVDARKTNGYGDTGQCPESPRWWPVLTPGKRMGIPVHLGCVGRLHPFGMDCGIRGATPRNHTSPGRWPGTSNKIENRGLKARSIHAPKAMFVREMMGMEEMLAQGR